MRNVILALMFVGTLGFAASNKIMNKDVDTNAAISYSKLNLNSALKDSDFNNSSAINYSRLLLTGSLVNADVKSNAAIAYSKLNLTGAILGADISASAAIPYSKLNLGNSITNTDVVNGAAINYSKLLLTGSLVNADISTSAAIAMSKLAALGNNSTVVTNGSGAITNGDALIPGSVLFANSSGLFGQNNSSLFWDSSNNRLGVGGQAGAGATLDVKGTAGGFGLPVLTDAQRNALSPARNGLLIWNSDNGRLEAYSGGWISQAPLGTPISLSNGGLATSTTPGGLGHVLASNAAGTSWNDSTVPVVPIQNISALNIDWSSGNIFWKTLSANTVFTFSGKSSGQTIVVKVRNPASYTVSWPQTLGGESVMWTGSVIPTATTGNRVSTYTLFYDGTNNEIVGSFLGNF